MSKYAFPIWADGDLSICTVKANSIEEAQAEIMNYHKSFLRMDANDWDDFLEELDRFYFTYIGDIVGLSELDNEDYSIN